jgi:hypothetical protein
MTAEPKICPFLSGHKFGLGERTSMMWEGCIGERCMLWVKAKIESGSCIHRAGCALSVKQEEERL